MLRELARLHAELVKRAGAYTHYFAGRLRTMMAQNFPITPEGTACWAG